MRSTMRDGGGGLRREVLVVGGEVVGLSCTIIMCSRSVLLSLRRTAGSPSPYRSTYGRPLHSLSAIW